MHFTQWFATSRKSFFLMQGTLILFSFFITLTSFVAVPSIAVAPPSAIATTPDITKIDSFIAHTMQEKRIPGIAVAIVHNDQVVHLRGFGKADSSGRSITAQTPFEIGSMTKSFTALAIMQLVEQGQVALDAPVQRYLPWFRLADSKASAQITLANLLHHTSGIPDGVPVEFDSLTQPTMTIEQYVRALNTVVPDRTVGGAFEYSNTNYVILGLIVQTVAHQSYANYVQQHILDPLQMQNTFLSYEQARSHGASQGYNWLFGVPEPVQHTSRQNSFPFQVQVPESVPQAQLPAGGIVSSAEDMSHYLIAMMNGGRYKNTSVLSAQDVVTLQTPAVAVPAVFPGEQGGYGMGWFNGTYYGVPAIFHTGTTLTFKSFQVMDPQRHWGAIILMNAATSLSQEPFDSIKSGVVHLLAGRDPEAITGLTFNMFYLITDIILVVLSVLIVGNLAFMARWYHKLPARLRGSRQRGWFKVRQILRIGSEIILALLLIVSVVFLLGNGSLMLAFVFVPDLSGWLLLAGGLLLVTGLLRGVLLWLRLHNQGVMKSGIAPNDVAITPQHMSV